MGPTRAATEEKFSPPDGLQKGVEIAFVPSRPPRLRPARDEKEEVRGGEPDDGLYDGVQQRGGSLGVR